MLFRNQSTSYPSLEARRVQDYDDGRFEALRDVDLSIVDGEPMAIARVYPLAVFWTNEVEGARG